MPFSSEGLFVVTFRWEPWPCRSPSFGFPLIYVSWQNSVMNPNHISLHLSLNYYVDTSKFILVSLSRVRGPFLFFLGQVKNWSGPHSVFKCIIHVCAHTHTWHSEMVVWQLECLGWCVLPVSHLCHQGKSPGSLWEDHEQYPCKGWIAKMHYSSPSGTQRPPSSESTLVLI